LLNCFFKALNMVFFFSSFILKISKQFIFSINLFLCCFSFSRHWHCYCFFSPKPTFKYHFFIILKFLFIVLKIQNFCLFVLNILFNSLQIIFCILIFLQKFIQLLFFSFYIIFNIIQI
jgi:hypothetical protein